MVFGAALALIALTVTVLTALSIADARTDLATLGAVGAPGRLRRLLSGWSALLVTGVGCLFGAALGLLPAWGMIRLLQQVQTIAVVGMQIPWVPVVALVVGMPLVAFGLAALFTRGKLPMVQRLA